jgi:hypothetical protein
MSDYARALAEGRAASPGDPNPYQGGASLAMAKCWLHGYQSMLKIRFWESPSQQPYVEARTD